MFSAATPSTALGHALLGSATPAPGARLAAPPRIVRLEFTEPLNPSFSGLMVIGPQGAVGANVTFPPGDPRGMAAELPVLAPGRYTVEWHTLSLIDGHTRSGAFGFGILDAAGRLPPAPPLQIRSAVAPLPGWLDVVARWALLLALAYLLGALAFAALARGFVAPERAAPSRAAVAVVVGVAWGALIEGIVSEAAGSAGLGTAPQVAVGTFAGQTALVVAGAVVVLACAVVRPAGLRAVAGWGAGVVTLVGLAATSHLAAGPGSAWGTLAMTVHLGAALVWPGTLFHLARVALADVGERPPLAPLLSRFSRLAAPSVALVLGSGLLAAVVQIPSPDALVSTGYGRTLLLKGALVGLLLVPAGLNAFRFRAPVERHRAHGGASGSPAGRHRRLRWATAAELLLAAAAMGVAAALSQATPARGELAIRSLEQTIASNSNPSNLVSSTVDVDGVAVDVNIAPGAPGLDQIDIDVPAVAGGPVPLRVQLVDPSGLAGPPIALSAGDREESPAGPIQAYDGFASLASLPGQWSARLTLRSGTRQVDVPVPLPLGALAPQPASTTGSPFDSPAPGIPAEVLLAIVVATLGMALAAVGRTRPGTRAWHLAPPVGGASLGAAALLVAIALAGSRPPPAPFAAARWGVVSRAATDRAGRIVEYAMPTPGSGLMIPAVAPNGQVWVGEMDGNKIAALDPSSGEVRELPLGPPIRSVMGLAVAPDGRVWWAEEATDQVGMLDPRTGQTHAFRLPTPNAGPVGITVAPSGLIWVTEQAAGRIAALDPANGTVREYAIPTPDAVPYWIATAPDGRLWFTEMDGRAVGVLDPATALVREYREPLTQGEPVGIAVDRGGTVWFATLSGSLGRLDPATGRITAIDLGTQAAGYGVAVDGSGRVWVGQLGSAIVRYDPASGAVAAIGLPTRDGGPWWPAIDQSGNVWVAEGALSANRLARIAP